MSSLFGGEISRTWTYYTTDTYEQVIASGYFDQTHTDFRSYDVINVISTVSGISAYYRFIVVGNSDGVVTIDDFPDEGLLGRINNLESDPPITPGSGSATITVSISDNSLQFTTGLNTDFVADRVIIGVGTDPAPSGTDGIAYTWTGTAYFPSPTYVAALSAYGTSYNVYAYARRASDGVWIQGTAADDLGYVTVTPNATAAPSVVTDFAIGTPTATTVSFTFTSPTVIDGADLSAAIVQGVNDTILQSDITLGEAGVLSGLYPGTDYLNVKLMVWVTGDPTRVSYSNPVSFSTLAASTVLSIDTLSVSCPAGQWDAAVTFDYTATGISSPMVVYSFDNLQTVSSPIAAGSFDSTVIDMESYGDGSQTLTVKLYDGDAPTNSVTDSYAFTVNNAETDPDDFTLDPVNSDLTFSEIGMHEGNIVLKRDNSSGTARTIRAYTADGGTGGFAALAGINYQAFDTIISVADVDTSVSIPFIAIDATLGHNDQTPNERHFTINLEIADGGGGTIVSSAEVVIQGSTGRMADGAFDTNSPPTKGFTYEFSTQQNITADDTDLENVRIHVDGNHEHALRLADQLSIFSVKKFIIEGSKWHLILFGGYCNNVSFVNGVMRDWGRSWYNPSGGRIENAAIYGYPIYIKGNTTDAGGNKCNDLTMRGVKMVGHGRGIKLQDSKGSDNLSVENCHFNNTWNRDTSMTRSAYKTYMGAGQYDFTNDGNLVMMWNTPGIAQKVVRNVINNRRDTFSGYDGDMINFGGPGSTSLSTDSADASRCFIDRNALQGSTQNTHDGSATGILVGDEAFGGTTRGYYSTINNIISESQNAGLNMLGNLADYYATRNWIYCGPESLEVHTNGVAIAVDDSTISDNATCTENNILWYRFNTGSDPALNLVYGTNATGLGTQYVMDGTNGNENWATDGDTIVKGLKRLENSGGIGHGFDIRAASAGCPAGVGYLRRNSTTHQLFFTPPGGEEGQGVSYNPTPTGNIQDGDWESWVIVRGADTSRWVLVYINPVLLASESPGDKTYLVKTTNDLLMGDIMTMPYDQDTGNYEDALWGGTEEISLSAPTLTAPTGFAATPTATTIQLECDDMTGDGGTGYGWMVDNIQVAETVSESYEYTPGNASSHNYSVRRIKTGEQPSAPCTPIAAAITGTVAGQLAAFGTWDSNNITSIADNGDGTFTFTQSDISGHVRLTVDISIGGTPGGGGAGVEHTVSLQHVNGTAYGRVVGRNSTSGYDWVGDLIESNVNDATLQPHTYYVTPTGTTFQLTLFFFGGVAGDTQTWTLPTVVET